jgi:hypothetical protein
VTGFLIKHPTLSDGYYPDRVEMVVVVIFEWFEAFGLVYEFIMDCILGAITADSTIVTVKDINSPAKIFFDTEGIQCSCHADGLIDFTGY